ncbi:rhomboid family intramembrane serine protease [Bacteriovoracaceae bacterium]|nr:rhomboid family intramembrane serine protease [Bacteriovoracaceae bacterium]
MQYYYPPLTWTNKMIIICSAVGFLLSSIHGQSPFLPLDFFLLSWSGIKSGGVTGLVFYSFFQSSLMSVLFNSLLIWFIGGELEQKWGGKLYLKLFIIAQLSTAVFYLLATAIFPSLGYLQGINFFCFTLIFFYGYFFSERPLSFMLIFPMKAKYFCLLLVGIQVYMMIFSARFASIFAHLMAFPVIFAYLKSRSLRAQGISIFSYLSNRKAAQKRRNLYVVSDDEHEKPERKKDDPKYFQ